MAKSFDNINRLVVGELDISQDQKKSYKITMTGDALKFLNRSNSSETFVLNKDGSCTFSNKFIINSDGSVSIPTVSSVVPSSPDSGGVVYIKSDGKLYFKNSSGEEYLLSDNVSGEVQTNRIAYTDGTDAITIEDGGYLKFAQGNRYSDSVLVSSDHSDHNEFIKFSSYTSRDEFQTTETTFLVTMVGWENHTAHDGDGSFIINVKYTYATGSPYYYTVGTRVTCEPINGSTLNGFDPSTDVILTVGSAGADLYIKAKEQNKRCFVSILGGTNQNDTSVSDESWQILTGQTWTSSVTSQGTNIGGTWVDKTLAGLCIGTTTLVPSQEKLRIMNNDGDNFNTLVVFGGDTTTEYVAVGVKSGVPTVTGGYMGTGDAPLAFQTSDDSETEQMRITAEGSVCAGDYSGNSRTWTDVSFGSFWENYGSVYGNVQYRNDGFGNVCLRGLAKANSNSATTGNGSPIFTLPSGYRPLKVLIMYTAAAFIDSTRQMTEIRIDTSGRLYLNDTNDDPESGAWVSLDGLSFSLDSY